MDKKVRIYLFSMIVLLIFFFVVFYEVAVRVQGNDIRSFDGQVIFYIQQNINDRLTSLMKAITFFGGKVWLTAATIVLSMVFAFRKLRYGVYLALTMLTGGIFNLLLKHFFERERPDLNPIIQVQGYSFPSGHSMSAIIFYTAIIVVLTRLARSHLLDVIIALVFAFIICMIGISRIYLGVHYPSDVVAGFAVGGFWVGFCSIVLRLFEYSRQEKR
ncbi:MAG: phosphatase PAP2 family protein [Bacillus sp. (in: firmicutes)]